MIAIVDLIDPAVRLCMLAAALFFFVGLLTGAWKYFAIAASPAATAPAYVDIAHRASLLYSFAALLIAQLVRLSAWSSTVNLLAAAAPLLFFALAIGGYLVHGLLNDTDNQFRRPQRVASVTLPHSALHGFMWLLMAAEIGGVAVLIAGLLKSLRWF
ncbi:MAG: hypothetical protein JWR16_2731 [Nevskia sp.]|nr:hypothetical protein [Nevskia sp.]